MNRWYVIYTQVHSETKARGHLQRQGYAVRVLEGPFVEMIGSFMGTAASSRVFVSLNLLGRQVRTTLSQAIMTPV